MHHRNLSRSLGQKNHSPEWQENCSGDSDSGQQFSRIIGDSNCGEICLPTGGGITRMPKRLWCQLHSTSWFRSRMIFLTMMTDMA